MRRVTTVLLTLALLLAVGAAMAPAKKPKKFKSEVTIESAAIEPLSAPTARNVVFTFRGEVNSRKARCERNRTVQLYDANQTAKDQQPELAGTATTNGDGDWSYDDPTKPPPDIYYAVVSKKKYGKPGKKKVCKADTSPDYEFAPF